MTVAHPGPSSLKPSKRKSRALRKRAAAKYFYRVAGLPVVVRRAFAGAPTNPRDMIREAYARQYFRADSGYDRLGLWAVMLTWPLQFLRSMLRYTRLNGRIIAKRHGRSIGQQVVDQFGLYLRLGILPRWYYIFSLYEPQVRAQAHCFLNRYETKSATFRLLNKPATSPLNDKAHFAEYCQQHGIPTVAPVAIARQGRIDWLGDTGGRLPERDLFAKPIVARGGRGAERWDHIGGGRFRSPNGLVVEGSELIERFRIESEETPRLIQPRAVNHPDITDLSNGALCTARVMTCLNEQNKPEVVAAVFRMAIGKNVTVDNIHAGGIAAEVGLVDGVLGPASNLGDDVRLGWLDTHPDTGAPITGRTLPLWDGVRSLAVQAHRACLDRTVIGWDIAIADDGPRLVEGNSGPDVDLLQRPMRRGLGCGRLGELMAVHLKRRGWGSPGETAD